MAFRLDGGCNERKMTGFRTAIPFGSRAISILAGADDSSSAIAAVSSYGF